MQDIVIEPPLYFAEEQVWSVCFHPLSDVLVCTQITGAVEILKYNSQDVIPLTKIKDIHKMSARHCCFNSSGNILATCGKDKRLGFVDTNGKIAHIIKKAHETAVNRVKFLDDNTLISGDDDGTLKIWDLRTSTAVFQASQQSEAITGILFQETNNFVLSSSLDGNFAVYDLRQGTQSPKKLHYLSDSIDEQLLSIDLMKQKQYVVCSSSEGSLIMYKWGQFAQYSDRIQGHPNSIDAMVKLDQNTLVTGSEDGFVRGVSIKPNKIVQVIGQHEQQQNFPIVSLSISRCRSIVASSSHDSSIKFYDINQFRKKRTQALDVNNQEEEEIAQKINLKEQADKDSDYESMSEEGSSDQESMESDKPKKRKGKKTSKTNIKIRNAQIKREQKMTFFKDL